MGAKPVYLHEEEKEKWAKEVNYIDWNLNQSSCSGLEIKL